MFWNDLKDIKAWMDSICYRVTELQIKMDAVILAQDVEVARKTLDTFNDYMKNIDKLNAMINEFKGCVSLARGSLEERKKVAHSEAQTVDLMLKIAEILRKQEKKSLKKRKSFKKKRAVFSVLQSE
jgi:hypothetical protein